MWFLRPKILALIATGYFGSVAYFAWQTARRTTAPWFPPAISQVVYQTAMVGGVLVVGSLLLIATLASRLHGSATPVGVTTSPLFRHPPPRSPTEAIPPEPDPPRPSMEPEWWAIEDFLNDREGAADRDAGAPRPDAAAVAAALSRLVPTRASDPGTLMGRLTDIRNRAAGIFVPDERQTEQALLRMLSEVKPILTTARRAGLNIPEVRRLLMEATQGGTRDLASRVRLVEQVKRTLESALLDRIAEDLQGVLADVERAKAMGAPVPHAEWTAAEGVTLLDEGNYAAAFDRAAKARETVDAHMASTSGRPAWVPAIPSFPTLAGPLVVAALYVAIAAMMLPGVSGFLEANFVLNTFVILTLSYGWLGLILYAVASAILILRPRETSAR